MEYSNLLSKAGFPLFEKDEFLDKKGYIGGCCFIPRFNDKNCEHSRTTGNLELEDGTGWGDGLASNLKDLLITPGGDRSEKQLDTAMNLSKWKTVLVNRLKSFYDNEPQPGGAVLHVVNDEDDAAFYSHPDLKVLAEQEIDSIRFSVQRKEDEDVLNAIQGMAAHIQSKEEQGHLLSVIRLIHQKAYFSPHTDKAPLDNLTSCVIEGRASLDIYKSKNDLTFESATMLCFEHDCSKSVREYGVKIPSVHIGQRHHSARLKPTVLPSGETEVYSAVWFSANFVSPDAKKTKRMAQ